ncbi:MAG: T9SS type A sorting domain-containing protein, partial [Bacteroidales bacterium]|nr:T9SS type A sorting domain-containing protein [Bacteroidales bacterium]
DLESMCFVDVNTGFILGDDIYLDETVLLKTIDAGVSWSSQSTTIPHYNYCTNMHFIDADHGFIAGNLIYRSEDGGNNWLQTTDNKVSGANSVFFSDSLHGIVVGYSGVYKTINGGTDWDHPNIPTSAELKSVYLMNSSLGIAVGDSGTIIKTIDGGDNWTLQNSGISNILNSVCFTDIENGYAVGRSGIILKTTDGGINWSTVVSGTTLELNTVFFYNEDIGYTAGGDYLSGTSVILKTTDGGESWNPQNSPSDICVFSIYFTNPNNGIARGFSKNWQGSMISTTDGGLTWSVDNPSTQGSIHHNSLFFVDENIGYTASGFGYIAKTINGGSTWEWQPTPTYEMLESIFFVDENTGWAVGRSTILKTMNGGFLNTTNLPIAQAEFNIYPNPVSREMVVEAISFNGLSELDLVNLNGQVIHSCQFENETTIDMSNYSSGIYLVKISNKEKSGTKKIIKY